MVIKDGGAQLICVELLSYQSAASGILTTGGHFFLPLLVLGRILILVALNK